MPFFSFIALKTNMLVKIVVEKETIIEMSVMLSMMIVSWIVLWRLGKHRQRIMLSQKKYIL